MKIAICEDERHWIESLKASISQWADRQKVDLHFDSFFSPQELLKHLSYHTETDAVFLDISLGEEIDGMTVARHIRKMGNQIPIIFVTVDSVRAADGYLVEAMGFLSKPVDEKRLALFLDRIIQQQKNERIIKVITENAITNLRQREIVFVEVMDHTITYHTIHTQISSRGTLGEVLDQLGDERFVQIHRAYVISKDKIHSIKTTYPYSVSILNGIDIISLPVSRKYIDKLLEIYSDDVLEKMI